jgi:hypothetical protein
MGSFIPSGEPPVTWAVAREDINLHHYSVSHNGIKIHDSHSGGGRTDAGYNRNKWRVFPAYPAMVRFAGGKNNNMNLSNAIIVYK